MSSAQFRHAMEAGDVKTLRLIWAQDMPHLPQPVSYEQAEIVMHRARTESASVTIRARCYSHRWLEERYLPSGLPDELKPSVDRLYPHVEEAVGISVNITMAALKPAAPLIQGAMSAVVEDIYADKRSPDPLKVKVALIEAKDREVKRLFGSLIVPKE